MWKKTPKKENFDRYLNVPQTRLPQPGDGFVMPYGDSPLDGELVGEQVYMDILYTAKKYVHIMTPYLIPDHDMITAPHIRSQERGGGYYYHAPYSG